MRWDMYEVIIERPRVGGRGWGFKGREGERMRDLADPEHARTFESTSRHRGGSKHLNENLAPLRRFLRSRVGRPWDAVHSEICATLRLTSAVQKHVLDHLRDMVYTRVVKDGETLVEHGRWGVRALGYYRRAEFYVCPDTGVLKETRWARRERPAEPRDVVKIDATAQYRRIDGIWYRVTLSPVPDTGPELQPYDIVLGRRLGENSCSSWDRTKEYGRGDVYASGKRQLGKRELRRLEKELTV